MSIKAVAWTVAGAVGEAALSSFFDELFDNLSSSDLLKIFRQKNVDADLKKWERTLLKIHAVLEDAEEKQMTSRSLKIWLDELEDLVYDMEDILDEFATEALRRKLHEEEPSTSKIRKFIPTCCVGFNLSSIKFDVGLRSKIVGINTRLQEIVTEREFLKLNDGAGGRTITKTSRPPTSSLVEGQTYGRDEDKEEIVKLLLEPSDAEPSVIPIVGMGGLGKTTLAQLVYNDDRVRKFFYLKAWVCVSEDSDNLRLTKEILHSFTSESWDNNSTLDSLQVKLEEKLSGNRFLLVLDDVWCESYDNWTILRKPFEYGALGSKIVVTTQSYYVSSKMGTTPAYELKELSRDACLSVFTHHALGASDFSGHPELEKYGQKIVDRVECEEFPCLRELSISNCPKLGKLPHTLPSLDKLFICACEQLVVSISSHSVLQELKIEGCPWVVHELINIKLKSTLRTLTIEGCSALESLEFVMDEGRASSTSSSLKNEENLSCIGNNNASLLEHLEISNCPSLKCISTIVDLATMLKHLKIEECSNLTSLSSRDTLPTTLKVLKLVGCPKLESIVDELNMDTLLEEFLIICCEKLRCLPRGVLYHLKKITIHDCNSLISLEDLIPTDLRSLEIEECEKLVTLPNNMHLYSLQTLSVCNCPSIVSFPTFTEEGFPTNFRELRELKLSGANLCEQVFELGLHRLTSLTSLEIHNGIMDSFPEEEDGKTMLINNFAKQTDLPSSVTIEASFKTWMSHSL
nr:putative disease resistance rpp13-like protein 1 [Quercus suber]